MWQCGSFYTLWIIVILLISFWINRFNPPGGLSNRTNVPPAHVWASCGAILKSAAGFVAVHSDDPEAKWQTSPCPKPTDVQSGQTCPRFWRRQVLGLPSFLVKSMSLTFCHCRITPTTGFGRLACRILRPMHWFTAFIHLKVSEEL